jgi:hypothetical protein
MNLRKLPPSMLLTLGLACGDGKGSDDTTTTVNACLSPIDPTEVSTGPCLDIDPSATAGETTSDETGLTGTGTGTGTGGSTFGPCLSPEPPTGTGTDTGTGTESGTGTDTGTGTGTTGMMDDEPPTSRAAALERVLDRGTLPADVAARLRDRRR